MATTLVHEPPSAKVPPGDGVRFVAVRARLLPDEIVSARRVEAVRRQVVLGVVTVVALLVAWFGLSWWQTTTARGDLSDAQHRGDALLAQQNQFHDLVSAQVQTAQIQLQLTALMGNDVPWSKLLASLRAHAPQGITLTTVTTTMTPPPATPTSPTATPTAQPALNDTGKPTLGTLTVAGVAGSKSAVATYADELNQLTGVTGALITSVTTVNRSVNFTVTATLTTDLRGGRYVVATPGSPTGGK